MDATFLLTLALSLAGPPLMLWGSRLTGQNSLALAPRLGLWALCGITLLLASRMTRQWRADMGLGATGLSALLWGVAAAILVFALWPLVQSLQTRAGQTTAMQSEPFQQLMQRAFAYRVFIVLTAAVTEEILYRGIGIGIGAAFWGGPAPALALSLAAFVAAHWRWGAGHLLSVFWAGLVISLLFVFTHDLWACMLSHAVIDAVGVLLAPALLATRARRANILETSNE